jgi:ParB/RepB/Spo0J family partition protein
MSEMRVSEIVVMERHRKDLGDIDGLAASIAEVGLLHPIVVKPDGTLIAGQRRLAAVRKLGWTETPVTTIDIESILRGEYAENVQRKDFTPSEAVAVWNAMESYQGQRGLVSNLDTSKRRDRAAEATGLGKSTLSKARSVVDAAEKQPEVFGDLPALMDSTNVDKAVKEKRKREKEQERKRIAETAKATHTSQWQVEQGDIRTYQMDRRFDFIITDPPYPKEYLPLYEVLARRALEWLKPTGLVLVMCGQSYLDQVMTLMGTHLDYYWTGCYLTPGQPTPLRTRQVNTTWKPILVYRLPGQKYTGKIFGDVWTSEGNDKEFHDWGQSVSGMSAIIQQVCTEGQEILDPFCGAGTTGVAAIPRNCYFYGIDNNAEQVAIARARLGDKTTERQP